MVCLCEQYPEVLDQVATINEVARLYGLNRRSIEYRIWRGDIGARRSAGTWLVCLASVRRVYGSPRVDKV